MMVVDIETSGTDPRRNAILSIGAVDFSRPENVFYGECRLRRGAAADPDALKYNGFTARGIMSKSRMTERALVKKFAEWASGVDDATIAGHNVHFDIPFLKRAAKLHRLTLGLGNRIVDMHTLAYSSMMARGESIPKKYNRTDITSDYVFRYVGIGDEPRPHNALTGARMEAEAISRLVLGRNLLGEYSRLGVPARLSSDRKRPKR